MIQANELRIGNWVCDRGDKVFQIGSWDGKTKVCAIPPLLGNIEPFGEMFGHPLTEEISYLKPIQLTPKILEKCGFRNYDDDKFDVDAMLIIKNGDGYLYLANQRHVNIFYLHQLQNLYFALTSEELECNL